MKVLYDITTLAKIHSATAVHPAGIFRATEALGRALADVGEVDLYLSAAPSLYREALRYLEDTKNFDIERFLLPPHASEQNGGGLLSHLHRNNFSGRSLQSSVHQYQEQHYAPERIYNPGKFDIYHVGWRGEDLLPREAYPNIVLTIFDIIALKHPEWFVKPGERNTIGEYLTRLLKSVSSGHAITVNAQSVKADLLSFFPHLSSEQIYVVPLGVSPNFRPCDDSAEIDAVKAKYGIPQNRRYILCVNTLEPRKNMISAIEAYSKLVRDYPIDDICLVLAGSNGWLYEEITSLLDKLGDGNKSPIVMTGFVEDADLPTLYSGASLFCYPSLDEGFGLPVLEAMRCRVPVVTSNRAPLMEVAGECALFVNPTDTSALAESMSILLMDKDYANELMLRGEARAKSYSWERSAKATAEAYKTVMESRKSSKPLRILPTGDLENRPYNFQKSRKAGPKLGEAQSLKELKDMYRGKRIIILGDGEGAAKAPLGVFKDEYTFGVNNFFRFYDRIKWKPTFYAVENSLLNSEDGHEINGLTGSTFFFEKQGQDHLRDGDDIFYYTRAALPTDPSDQELFSLDASVEVRGPRSAVGAAIQLAYHMGFDPIYLVACDLDGELPADHIIGDVKLEAKPQSLQTPLATNITTQANVVTTQWRQQCRAAIEGKGRQIFNTAKDDSMAVYEHRDFSETLATEILPGHPREAHATLDETEVVSTLFMHESASQRIMIDVGAHRGHSAKHFVNKNWKIHCFEPDVDNRESHLVKRFRDCPNVTIDPRAVGEKPMEQVPFFTSEQSSGISGLSAFHSSHKRTSYVDITTVAAIIDQFSVAKIDFLKIDVEGFDFSVLKGVPWDRIMPGIIECEYEDAKTVPMGHTWRDIADFLREKGYFVYISEWYPIIRYGIPHDWRRVVPYPGVDVPSDSWGNILAFRDDPGYEVVQSAFAALVRSHKKPAPAPVPKIKPVTPPRAPAPVAKRPFYSAIGDQLMHNMPRVFTLMRFTRRALAGLWRRRVLTVPAMLLLAALIALGFAPAFTGERYFLWAGAAFASVMFGLFYLALRIFQIAHALSAETAILRKQADEAKHRLKTSTDEASKLRGRLDKLLTEIAALKTGAAAHAMRLGEIEQDGQAAAKRLKAEIDEVVSRGAACDEALKSEITKAVEAMNARAAIQKRELNLGGRRINFLRERVAAGERQIGMMRYPKAPPCIVFFGHHKCGSRFFRYQIFAQIAEMTGARIRRYVVKEPPFHYSRMDELDLCNIDFDGLGENGRDVVMFANASKRALEKINQAAASDWRGLRVLRDPRQILASSYLHHIGEHDTHGDGWVWDQLVCDKPILNELSQEDGLLYELDHISKQVIEEQLLEPFADERVLTIKLEDFSEDPRAHLARVAEFLQVTDIAGINYNAKHTNKESRPWQQVFSSKLREVFKERYGQALIDLGYAKDFDW